MPPKPPVSVFVCELVLAVMALLSILPAPVAVFGLDTWVGRSLYIGFVVLVIAVMILAHRREEGWRGWERQQRDAAIEEAADRRHNAIVEGILQGHSKMDLLLQRIGPAHKAVEQTGPVGAPLAKIVEATGTAAGRAMIVGHGEIRITGGGAPVFNVALRGTATATPARSFGTLSFKQLDEATELLQEIAENPPTTAEAVQAAVRQLKEIGIAEETDQALPITPMKSTAWHKMPPPPWPGGDDELPTQQPITPSASDSEVPPSKEDAP